MPGKTRTLRSIAVEEHGLQQPDLTTKVEIDPEVAHVAYTIAANPEEYGLDPSLENSPLDVAVSIADLEIEMPTKYKALQKTKRE